ncbi:MAG: nitrogenase molybdenum-iron protein subunit beta [Spirochaetales bacterium]|nr:nitrogenase molybdenum-iron protein subunit beta [Spirochaetales bacterium]
MLLRHTPKEVIERNALTINPAKTCQPIGAMYAALGIHRCFPHSHGSQGCCAYHRSTLTRHYKEPIMAGTSSFTEGASVFGGQANLVQALDNIYTIYKPDIVAVHTTCLSETIGDDIPQIVSKAQESGKIPEGKYIVYASTPSYVGSHITGFANMVSGIIQGFANQSERVIENRINIIPGWVEPSDMAEIRRMMSLMRAKYIMVPDTSDVLDAPLTGRHEFYPKGGTTIKELQSLGESSMTLALGHFTSVPGAETLRRLADVPYEFQDIPIGISATDRFLMAASHATGAEISESLETERGQLVDMISDMQQYLYGKSVAIYGDPDQLIGLTEFLLDLDMHPKYIISGSAGKVFTKRINALMEKYGKEAIVKNGPQADMFYLHQLIKNEKVDLLIGNTYGKYMARDEDIPFLRYGFPILDRVGHSYFPSVGYKGAMYMLKNILDLFLDRKDRDAPEESFELVM